MCTGLNASTCTLFPLPPRCQTTGPLLGSGFTCCHWLFGHRHQLKSITSTELFLAAAAGVALTSVHKSSFSCHTEHHYTGGDAVTLSETPAYYVCFPSLLLYSSLHSVQISFSNTEWQCVFVSEGGVMFVSMCDTIPMKTSNWQKYAWQLRCGWLKYCICLFLLLSKLWRGKQWGNPEKLEYIGILGLQSEVFFQPVVVYCSYMSQEFLTMYQYCFSKSNFLFVWIYILILLSSIFLMRTLSVM